MYYEQIELGESSPWSVNDYLCHAMEQLNLNCEDLTIEPDVHQLLFLAPTLPIFQSADGSLKLDEAPLLNLIYRNTLPTRPGYRTAGFPPELNRGMDCIGVVGSYVSVMGGHQDYVENACVISAASIVAASTELREIHDQMGDQFRVVSGRGETQMHPGERRAQLAKSAKALTLLEVKLREFVESQMDIGVWVPSLRIEDFHNQLVASLRIPRRCELAGQGLVRLEAIAQTEARILQSEENALNDHRRRVWALAAGVTTTIAIPVTIALAFFAIRSPEVSDKVPIFSLSHYWGIYLFLIGVVVLVGGVVAAYWFLANPARRSSDYHE